MESVWQQNCKIDRRAALEKDIEAEVAVIGAGMAGILIANELQERGLRVAVLERARIGGGQTGGTTAKITSQHGLIYRKLMQLLGEERAGRYAAANEQAIERFRSLIAKRNIECDFEEQDAYLYSEDREEVRAEAETTARLGLPARFLEKAPLPFGDFCALRFAKQAQFHPLKFLKELSADLTVYENTPAKEIEEHRVLTPRGSVAAEKIVFACHFPFVNFPGMYFARMHQQRSYVIALENAEIPDGMWIGAGKERFSIRHYRGLLLFGGAGHRCGENREGGRYDLLRAKAQEWFPGSRERAHFSAQDCIPADGVPYIGVFAAQRPDWFVATGFQKWGMTSSMVAATLIADAICGVKNEFAEVFDPGRFNLPSASGIARESAQAVKGLTKRFLSLPEESAKEIPRGHGGVVWYEGEKAGVYKDGEGRLFPVDIVCPHLGCQLSWNPDERAWECPCHGSRFDASGKLISGPAERDCNTVEHSTDPTARHRADI